MRPISEILFTIIFLVSVSMNGGCKCSRNQPRNEAIRVDTHERFYANEPHITVVPNLAIKAMPAHEQLPQTVGRTETNGGLTFTADWVFRSDPEDPSLLCANPIWESIPGKNFVSAMTFVFFDNGDLQSPATPFLGWARLTASGYCLSMKGLNLPKGTYHFSAVSLYGDWLQYSQVWSDLRFRVSSRIWLELGRNLDGSRRNSVGGVGFFDGESWKPSPRRLREECNWSGGIYSEDKGCLDPRWRPCLDAGTDAPQNP